MSECELYRQNKCQGREPQAEQIATLTAKLEVAEKERDAVKANKKELKRRYRVRADMIRELKTKLARYEEAMLQMCFCKRHICKQCGHIEELPDRCENEQIRDKLFREQALKEQTNEAKIQKT